MSISVRNIVNSSVQHGQEKGVTCVKVDFFYLVKVITSGEDQSSCIIMRCNPVWDTAHTMQSRQNQWFDWVEVDWMTIMAMCTLSLLHLIYSMGWSDIVF